MSTQNKKGLNIIDIIIIAVLIIGIAAAAFIFLRPSSVSSKNVQYMDFTIELPALKQNFYGLIKSGDPVIETVRHSSLGYVTVADYTPAAIATTDMTNEGSMKMADYPDHFRGEITIRAPYTINENGEYSVEGITVAVGAYIHFSTPDFITSGYCIKLSPLSPEESQQWHRLKK